MYTIHADGELMFSTALLDDEAYILLNPKVSPDVGNHGSLSFVLPPGNRMRGKLKKLKSILTVEQDGEQIFRGRLLEVENDKYNQQNMYCEGDRSFLYDSQYAPYSYSGSVHDFFRTLIANHNSMVEADRQFTVGEITAVGSGETLTVEDEAYADTFSVFEDKLLNVYGGYLKTRTVDGVHYVDWVKEYSGTNTQPIEFAVNLLDLTDKASANDVFTVLIPLGASEIGDDGDYTEPLSIAGVNGGLNYIQDDEGVTLYGKIWRTHTWPYEEDASELLKKAQEYLKTGIALETLTLHAIDMHFVDGNVQPIRIGDMVHIISNPHGLDKTVICAQMEIDLLNPESTVYTFGEKPRTLTENVVRAEEEVEQLTGHSGGGGGRKNVQQQISDIIRWAQINTDETNAYIQLTAGELDKTKQQLSAAEIEIDGVQAEISLAASRLDDVEGRTTNAEIAISGAEAKITLHASSIESLNDNMTQAQIDIDGLNSEITLKADKVEVEGLLNARFAEVAARLETTVLVASQAQISSDLAVTGDMHYGGTLCNWKTVSMGDVASVKLIGDTSGSADLQHSHAVTVNDDGTVTLGEVSSSGGSFKIADTKAYQEGVSAAKEEGYAEGETKFKPTALTRIGVSTSNQSVTVKATNAAGEWLTSAIIDAGEIHTAGYDSGWSNGYNSGYDDGYGEGEDDGYSDGIAYARNNTTVTGSPTWEYNESTGLVRCKVALTVKVAGSTVYSNTLSYSKYL